MRVLAPSLIALAALIVLAAPVQAVPVPPHEFGVSGPMIAPVRQRCGAGMKRAKAWQDKQGAWHGPCVPKHPTTAPASR